jgi:hypothetical protein
MLNAAIEWDIPEDMDDALVVDTEIPTIEQCLAAGAKGVDITNEHYHSLPGISGSNLTLLAESNKHLDNRHLFFTSSPALVFGSLLHTMVLEPHDVDNRYVVMPSFDLRTNKGKADKEQFIAKNEFKTVIEAESFETAQRMARNVRAICGDIIDRGIKERSLFVEQDGLILKSRLDIDLEQEGDDYDVKTISLGTKDFSDSTIETHIKKFKYHWAAALRNIVRRELGKPVRDSYLIFCNTGSGHFVRVIKMAPAWINEAESVVSDMLEGRRFYLASKIDTPVIEIDDRSRKYDL